MRAPPRRPLSQEPSADTDAIALRALVAALLAYLRELLLSERDADTLLDVAEAVPLPRRVLFAACRRGEFISVKRGPCWVATRKDIDNWLRLGAPHLPPSTEDDELEPLRRSLMRPESHRRRGAQMNAPAGLDGRRGANLLFSRPSSQTAVATTPVSFCLRAADP
jgi:hypothetical protein